MKLGSLKEGGRDGTLIVVDRALKKAVRAGAIAPTLQKAFDDWKTAEPKLSALAQQLADGKASAAFDLDTRTLAAPLPRAYQWADGSAYVVHVELVRKARGVEMPPSFWTDPLMYQGGSDGFIGPRDDIEMGDEAWGIDFESE
ncbi:MAG TPA: 2-keto-4-pentenoate hydratase, partial [Reyranella sp.]